MQKFLLTKKQLCNRILHTFFKKNSNHEKVPLWKSLNTLQCEQNFYLLNKYISKLQQGRRMACYFPLAFSLSVGLV